MMRYAGMQVWRVIDVALRCGFGGQSRFGTVFKERFGCTPTEYAMHQRD